MIGKVSESSALEITTRMEFEDFEKNKDNTFKFLLEIMSL